MPPHHLTDHLTWAILARAAAAEPNTVHELLREHTAQEAVDALITGSVEHTQPRTLADLAARDLDQAAAIGARLITPQHPHWPLPTTTPTDPKLPVALWMRGPLHFNRRSQLHIAITGACAATDNGRRITAEFTKALVDRQWHIVSRVALGIGNEALSATLAHGGTPIAVSPVGLAHTYPIDHRPLLDRIAATGLVISQYPPDSRAPTRAKHQRCQQLLADLGQALVIPEAGARATALHAADRAHEHDRPILATPGPADEPASVACRALIATGQATAVTSSEQLVHHLNHDPRTWS
ncbi:DNA-processing protein DprA [Nocardia carnea]|uniref:DNA-processing protein DprA n=1 Tax=Nocardia carnea TaxID=37328 RepID=UPI002457C116|nr:DNA-processing protein DprA [Nocardia carnea]